MIRVVLYILTLVLELVFSGIPRGLIWWLIGFCVVYLLYPLYVQIEFGHSYNLSFSSNDPNLWILAVPIGVFMGGLPIVISLITVASGRPFVGSGWAFLMRQRARRLSKRERRRLMAVLAAMPEDIRKQVKIGDFWILPSMTIEIWTYGKSILFSRTALDSDYFPALLAHEIGHVVNKDTIYLAALRAFYGFYFRLFPSGGEMAFSTAFRVEETPWGGYGYINRAIDQLSWNLRGRDGVFEQIFGRLLRLIGILASGGLFVTLLRSVWADVFHLADYEADEVAAVCGYRWLLVDFLETYGQFMDRDFVFQPPSELRIENLIETLRDGMSGPGVTHVLEEADAEVGSNLVGFIENLVKAGQLQTVFEVLAASHENEQKRVNLIRELSAYLGEADYKLSTASGEPDDDNEDTSQSDTQPNEPVNDV